MGLSKSVLEVGDVRGRHRIIGSTWPALDTSRLSTYSQEITSLPLLVPLTCHRCGEGFERRRYDYSKSIRRGVTEFYCGRGCSLEVHNGRQRTPCPICGGVKPRRNNKYCSPSCEQRAWADRKPKRACPECGTTFSAGSSRQVYCKRGCANRAHARRMVGRGNSHYKTGRSYALWFDSMRPLILERDGDRCVACGAQERTTARVWRGRPIQVSSLLVHHINEDTTNNRPQNLITLCATCHVTHHKSKTTPWPWFGEYAVAASRSMTSRWKGQATSLRRAYSSTTA